MLQVAIELQQCMCQTAAARLYSVVVLHDLGVTTIPGYASSSIL